MNRQIVFAVVVNALMLNACGGSGGSGGSGGGSGAGGSGMSPSPPLTYTVGGTVTGLRGSNLVLQNNGGDDIGVAADGSFTFASSVARGETYAVTVANQPIGPWQTCAVTNSNGVVGTADVTDVEVNCTTNAYAVGGTVSGLSGSGLVLQNNGGDDLPVAADGDFRFTSPVPSGDGYNVTVLNQPTGPTCSVSSGTGTVEGENVATVTVNCSADTYNIGGTVNGLLGSGLTLRKNGTDILTIAGNGSFVFNTALAGGTSYIVAVAVQPTNPAQTCTVTDGFGTVAASNVTSVIVDCIVPNTSGSLDLSFDADGIALTDLSGVEDFGRAVVLQPDSKIVVVGYARTNGALYEFALARYDADGSLDTSFGNGTGMVTENFDGGDSRANAVSLQSDGKIVVAGSAHNDFALARFNVDGSLDTSFGPGQTGKVTTNFGIIDRGLAVAIDPIDGSIVVVGETLVGNIFNFAVARYDVNGSLDLGFDTDGQVTTDFNLDHSSARAVAIQPDGMIVVAGYADTAFNNDFAVVRYLQNGSLDATGFGTLGKVTTNIGNAGRADFGHAIALQATGEIFVGGYTFNGANNDFALVRYTAAGDLDTSFDADGKVTTDIGGAGDEAYGMALDAVGNILLAGRSFNGVNYDFALVRYTPAGAPDPAFSVGGILATPVSGDDDEAYGVAIQPDGKIVAIGNAVNGASTDFALIRALP